MKPGCCHCSLLTSAAGSQRQPRAFSGTRPRSCIKIEPDKLTIYPLAVDRVPGPDHWMNAPRGKANPLPNNPKLIAVKPIDVRLIENPIVITNYDDTYE